MPALAFLLSSAIFAGNTNIVTGSLIEYSVPIGIVSFMWVGMFSGNTALALTSILVSTLGSPNTIPIKLKLLMGASIDVDAPAMMFDMTLMIAAPALASIDVDAPAMMFDMTLMIAAPALGGMIVNDLTRGWGRDVLSPAAAPLSKIFLVLIITSNSTAMSEYVLHITWKRLGVALFILLTWKRLGVALFILLFALSGFGWGALVARVLRVNAPTAVTMSFDCGLRNISSGAVIATRYFPGEVVFPVMCGTLAP